MTRESTQARAAALDMPRIAYVAQYSADGEEVEFVVSEDDLDRDAAWVSQLLSDHRIARGDIVVIAAFSWESAWFDAVRVGANLLGASYANCEARRGDAKRLDMLIRRLEPAAVIGVTPELLDGLQDIDFGLERLAGVPKVFVRHEETAALTRHPSPRAIAMIGPALAMSSEARPGMVVNDAEWVVTQEQGKLQVRSTGARTTQFGLQPTGLSGRVWTADGLTRIHLA